LRDEHLYSFTAQLTDNDRNIIRVKSRDKYLYTGRKLSRYSKEYNYHIWNE